MNPHSARLTLAKNLRIIRLLRNLSQETVADLVGIDRSYLGGIERAERNVSLYNLEKISAGLGVSITELLTEPDPNRIASQLLEAVNQGIHGGSMRIREEPALYDIA